MNIPGINTTLQYNFDLTKHYDISKLLSLPHIQEHMKTHIFPDWITHNIHIERFPFYLLSTLLLGLTIVLSLLTIFDTKQRNYNDYFPLGGIYRGEYIHDESWVDKICWYFSQLTHHTLWLLFGYFLLAFIGRKSEGYFKMIAPQCLTVSILYFVLLFPHQKTKVHELSFYNLASHLMIVFLVLGEMFYVKTFTYNEITHSVIFLLIAFLFIILNYGLRGVWSYNLVQLDKYSGWSIANKAFILQIFIGMLFCLFVNRKTPGFGITSRQLLTSTMFWSGIINLCLFDFVYVPFPFFST